MKETRLTKKQLLLERIKSEKLKCFICGGDAHYAYYVQKDKEYKPCCSEAVKQCPGHKEYFSINKKLQYQNDPNYRKNMSKAMKSCQNRQSVKNKKSEMMKTLHRTDPVFQENYRNGRIKFQELVGELAAKNEHWSGEGDNYFTKHFALYKTHKKSYCELCGCSKQLCNHVYNIGLHLHNVSGDIDDTSFENWITLCPRCHVQVHHYNITLTQEVLKNVQGQN